MHWFGFNAAHALARVAHYALILVGIAALVFVVPQLLLRIIEWIGHLWQTGPLALWLPFKPQDPLANAATTRSWVEALSTILVAVIVAYVLIRLAWTLSNSSNRSRLVIERFTDAAHPPTKQNEATSSTSATTATAPSSTSLTDGELQLLSLQARETLVVTMRQIKHILKFHGNEQDGLGKYCDPPPGGSVASMDYALGAYSGTMADAPLPKEVSWVNPLMGLLSQPRCTRVAGTVQFCPDHPSNVKAITFEIVDITTTDEPEIFTIPHTTAMDTMEPQCPGAAACASTSAQVASLAPIALALELLRRDMLNHPQPPVIWERRHAARVNNFIAVLYGRLANTYPQFCYDRAVAHLRESISLDRNNYRAHANLADRYTIWGQQVRKVHPALARELHKMAVAEYKEAFEHIRVSCIQVHVEWFFERLLLERIPWRYRYTNQLILLHAALARARLLTGDVDYYDGVKKHLDEVDKLVNMAGGPENIIDYRTLYYLACLYAVYAQQHDQLPECQRPRGATWADAQTQASQLLAYSLVRNSEQSEDQAAVSALTGNWPKKAHPTAKIEEPHWYYWKRALEDEDLESLNRSRIQGLQRLLLSELRKNPALRTMKGKKFDNTIAIATILKGNEEEKEEQQQTPIEIVITGSSAPDGYAKDGFATCATAPTKTFRASWWHYIQIVVVFLHHHRHERATPRT